jgi:hypothetical protein
MSSSPSDRPTKQVQQLETIDCDAECADAAGPLHRRMLVNDCLNGPTCDQILDCTFADVRAVAGRPLGKTIAAAAAALMLYLWARMLLTDAQQSAAKTSR